MQPGTRALDPSQENAVHDLNFYVVACSTGSVVHHSHHTTAADVVLELTPGDYAYYAIANAGADPGELSAAGLEELSLPVTSESSLTAGSRLPMSARQTFSVLGATNVTVALERCAAKLTLQISTAASYGDFTLHSIQVTGVPRSLKLFATGKATAVSEVTDYPKANLTGRSYSADIYLPENMQGSVGSIADPRQRCRDNAPPLATCLHIEGEASGQKIDFYIYPGENTTTDFNIRRNRHYTLNATICGASSIDLRLTTLSFTLAALKTSCCRGEQVSSELILTSTDPAGSYTLSYRHTSGSGTVTLDGKALAENTAMPLFSGSGTKHSTVKYVPEISGNAALDFTLRDSYGYTIGQTLVTTVNDPLPIEAYFKSSPVMSIIGTKAYLVLWVQELNYSGKFTLSLDCSDPNTTFSIDGSKEIACREEIALAGGSHQLTFIPRSAGKMTVYATLRDSYNQSCTTETSFQVREPIVTTSVSAPAVFDAHTQTPVTLDIAEENYTENFTVSYTSTGQNSFLYHEGRIWQKDTPITLKSGSYGFNLLSAYPEAVTVSFTVTDREGRSSSTTAESLCQPLLLTITLTTYVDNFIKFITKGIYSGPQNDPTRLMIRATADKYVPGNVTIRLDGSYTLGQYFTTAAFTETPMTRSIDLSPLSGSTPGSGTLGDYTGYCMGSSSSSRSLLIPGYYYVSVYDRSTGTSHVPVTVTVKRALATGVPQNSLEYRYIIVNN